jgi:predicted amidophosphoribosyltransferase
MDILHAVVTGVVPPLCAACGRSCRTRSAICSRCGRRLAAAAPLRGGGPGGIDCAWSTAAYEGVARELVVALKLRRLLPVADLMAERIAWLAPGDLLSGSIVPVPSGRWRGLRRGFDPAGEIAGALAERVELPLESCLARKGGGRQVGRPRNRRVGDPPRVYARGAVPGSVLLIDDVLTTGATLTACARALREAGASRVVAITFARRL